MTSPNVDRQDLDAQAADALFGPLGSPNGLSRRDVVRAAAIGAGFGPLVSTDLFAAEAEAEKAINQTVSEHARAETLPDWAYGLPRFRPAKTGGYDLRDPVDNHYAFAKAQANLAGETSWLAQYGWIVIAPPGEPAFPFLGRLTLIKVFLTPTEEKYAPNAGEHDYMAWGTFTTTHVDPRTFEPVSKTVNPYIGREIDVPTLHYADKLVYRVGQSIVVPGVDPAFYDQPWDRAGGYSQHFIDAGTDISYTVLGSAQKPGPHQPRCDVGFWTVQREALMDPKRLAIPTRRDYSVIQKMTEYAWYGAPAGDPAQLLVHLTGMKTDDPAQLPSFIKTHVLERFPDRFST